MYLLLLLVGSLGFLAMTLLGFMHGGGARMHHAAVGHAHAGSHTGGAHAGTHSGSHSGGRTSAPSGKSSGGRSRNFPAWLMISPMDIFAFSLGAGAAGQIFQHIVGASLLPLIAIIGALAFNLGLVKPMMSFMMKFVSKPSDGLESVVAHTAEAVTRFDSSGRGLVRITLDGQVIQILAMLEDADIHHGVIVNKGDEVVVVEVDAAKNVCRVSKEL